MKSVFLAYKEMLGKIVRTRTDPLIPNDLLQADSDQKNILLYDDDLTCAIRLFEAGYDIKDVMAAIKKHSPMMDKLETPKAKAIYIGKILDNINTEWTHKAENSFAVAQASYKLRMNALQKKYEEYEKHKVGLYQDGEIALALVIKEGFTPKVAETVVKHNSTNKEAEKSAYLSMLHDCLADTEERYRLIRSASNDSVNTSSDIYRAQAKKYMEDTHTAILTSTDEQKIIDKIYTGLISKIQENMPEYRETPDKLDALMDTQIKPFLRKAIVEASPVYTEPGRDRDAYLTSVLAEFESDCKTRKNMSSLQYPAAQEIYRSRMRTLHAQVTDYINLHDKTFMDGIAAKELLDMRQAPANILRAIEENSEVRLGKDSTFEDMKSYAEYVLKKAGQSLHAEKEILNFERIPEIPAGGKFADTGLTIKQIFQKIMKERIDDYPSFALELTEPFADRDTVEKIIHQYPDYNQQELKKAIMEASPRAQLPGIRPEYAEEIIRQAEARLEKVHECEARSMELQKEFNKLRGLSAEGVEDFQNPMMKFKDGRIAAKLLRKHTDKADIKKYLVTFAKASSIALPFAYADQILAAASLVLKREQAIASYAPKEHGMTPPSCTDIYLQKMHDKYQQKGFADPSMDIRVMKEILEETEYKPQQIERIVLSQSPVAAEAGRDDGYGEYVLKQALLEQEKEKERLARYVIMPRPVVAIENMQQEAERPSCESEYLYQRNKMTLELNMKWNQMMDVLLTKALHAAGYGKKELIETLDNFAPESFASTHPANSYGKNIFQEAGRLVTEERSSTLELVRAKRMPETPVAAEKGE